MFCENKFCVLLLLNIFHALQIIWWTSEIRNGSDTLHFYSSKFCFLFSVVSQSLLRETLAKGLLDDKGFIDFFRKYFRQKQTNTALMAFLSTLVLAPPGCLAFKSRASPSSVTFCQSLWCVTYVKGSAQRVAVCSFRPVIVFGKRRFDLTFLLPPHTLDKKWILRKDQV